MKNVNVKVVMNAEGQFEVVGLNKDGSVSAVNYTVVETVGVKEFAKNMMAAGAKKQLDAVKAREASEPKASEPVVDKKPEPKKEETTVVRNKKGYESIKTGGSMFTNLKGFKHEDIFHAVKFEVADKGECIVGFAKDRNAFMEHFNGELKEVTRTDVLKRLAKYEGKDAAKLTKMIQGLKPVSLAAGQCNSCGCDVSNNVKEYSVRKYGVILCRDCQKDFNPTPVKKEAQSTETPKAPSDSEAQKTHALEIGKASAVCPVCEEVAPAYEVEQTGSCLTCAVKEDENAELESETFPEFNLGYGDTDVEAEQGEADADDASEERASVEEEGTSEEGSEVVVDDQSALFDESELMVNAGYKGMNDTNDGPVE